MNALELRSRGLIALLVAAYIGVVAWNYVAVIVPVYGYQGYELLTPNPVALLVGLVAVFAPVLWLPIDSDRPSALVYYVLYALVYIPACLVPVFTIGQDAGRYIPFQLCLAASLWIVGRIYLHPLYSLGRWPMPTWAFWAFIILWSCFAFFMIVQRFGLRLNVWSLEEVYDVRQAYKDAFDDESTLLIYILQWQANIFTPLVFLLALRRNNFAVAAAACLAQLVIYSISAHKTALFSIVYLLAMQFVVGSNVRSLAWKVLAGLIAVAVVSTLGALYWDWLVPSNLFVRRLLLTPGLLSGHYFDFFTDNPKAMLGHSVLAPFVSYPYETTPAYLIGNTYRGAIELSANAHVWADAFCNFGYAGMIGFSLLLAGYLYLFDSAARGLDPRIAVPFLGMPALVLANTAFFTALASHGMALALLLVFIMPRQTELARPGRPLGEPKGDGGRHARPRPRPASARSRGRARRPDATDAATAATAATDATDATGSPAAAREAA